MEKSKFSITHKDESMVELVRKTDPKTLAVWAMDCVEWVLPYFEENIRKTIALEALSKHSRHGSIQGCLRWLTSARLRLHLMPPLVK